MFDYYKHKQHKFIPATISMSAADPKMQMPTVAAKQVVFFAHLLRDLPAEIYPVYSAVLPMILTDVHFLMAVLHNIGTPTGKSTFQRIASAVRRAGDDVGDSPHPLPSPPRSHLAAARLQLQPCVVPDLCERKARLGEEGEPECSRSLRRNQTHIPYSRSGYHHRHHTYAPCCTHLVAPFVNSQASKDAGSHLAQVPVQPVEEWVFPFEDASFVSAFKTKIFPFEVAGEFVGSVPLRPRTLSCARSRRCPPSRECLDLYPRVSPWRVQPPSPSPRTSWTCSST